MPQPKGPGLPPLGLHPPHDPKAMPDRVMIPDRLLTPRMVRLRPVNGFREPCLPGASSSGQPGMVTLGNAAKQLGISKPTLSKAIAKGHLSATRREDGSFAIDPSELVRWWDG